MSDFDDFYEALLQTPLAPWSDELRQHIEREMAPASHGDMPRWLETLRQLPRIAAGEVLLDSDSITVNPPCDEALQEILEEDLREFHPWRKGPFTIHGVHIDTEWRSDLKWNRLKGHIQPLQDRLVLDAGCGNGYHCWRMAGAGTKLVIGIDPTPLYVMQYFALRHFIGERGVHVLPLGIEDLPPKLGSTGSRPAQLPLFPFDGEHILSSDDALSIQSIPKTLIIIGAGVIGCEFAFIFSELGTDITMLEIMPRALSTEDPEISEILERDLKKKKIKLMTGAKITGVQGQDDGIHVYLEGGKELVAEKLLVSVGRALNSDGIGLEAAGIQKGSKGEIAVNEKMETNIGGIYAIGDVTGGLLYAHVASREGIVAAKNITGNHEKIDYSVVPSTIFTSPEIASVGLKEQQALEKGIKVKTGHFQFRAIGKAHAMGEITGFFKIVSDETSDKILGAQIIGPHASDLIHEAALAIRAGLSTRDIAKTIHSHPTLSEGLMEAAEDVYGEAIHVPKK